MRPISKNLQEQMNNYSGNFGLYFNKFVEINYNKLVDSKCKEPFVDVEKILEIFKKGCDVKVLLDNKHKLQKSYLESMKSFGYTSHEISMTLMSNMILGIGETNPGEVGMVFDHTIGVPYIPASSIKGVVRFTHLYEMVKSEVVFNYIKREDEAFDDEAEWTDVWKYFGGNKKIDRKIEDTYAGSVVFLDAYPTAKPILHTDIMNPHYGEYYQDGKPPADYLSPVPIKFLTVKAGTEFTFRVLIKDEKLETHVIEMLKKALKEHGLGAKTAIGYGVFGDKQTDIPKITVQGNPGTQSEKKPAMKVDSEITVFISRFDDGCIVVIHKETGWTSKIYNNALLPWVLNAKAKDLEIKVKVTEISPENKTFKSRNKY